MILLLLVVWGGYNLAVLLKTGFISDDAYNSQIRGALIQDGRTLYARTLDEILGWITGAGRFFPLGWYNYSLFYFIQNVVIVKLITLIIIIADIILFAIFAKNETKSKYIGFLAGLTIPVFFQFRLWHDPILAFAFLIPLIFLYLMGSLVLFQKYIDGGAKNLLFFSVFLYLLALLTYEITYPFGILFGLLAFAHSRDIKWSFKVSWPFISLSVIFVALMPILRIYFLQDSNHDIQSTYPGSQLHTNFGFIKESFKVQAFSSFPLSYYLSSKVHLKLLFYKSDVVFISTFFIGILFLIVKLTKEKILARLDTLVISGGFLLILPALVISLSGHQKELIEIGYGFGYIPVYFQYFGLCLIFVAGLIHICRNLSPKFVFIFAVIFGTLITTIATINLGLNRAVALETNKFYKYPRQLLESALKAGLMADVKENALLLRTMRFPSDYTWLYTTVTGKKFNICDLNEITAYKKCISTSFAKNKIDTLNSGNTIEVLGANDAWILSYSFDKQGGEKGQVFLGKIDRIIQDAVSKEPVQIVVKKLLIYQLDENKIYPINLEERPINFLKIVENEDKSPASFGDFSSTNILAEDTEFRWLGGVFGREGSEKMNLRWSSGTGKLVLYNFSNKPQTVKFSMRLGVPGEEGSHLWIKYPEHIETLNLNPNQIAYSKTLSLPPGETVITFTSDGEPIANGDPRKIVFGIFDFEFTRLQGK